MTTLVREDLSETPLSILEERRGVAQESDTPDPDIEKRVITTYGCYSESIHTLFISSILFLTTDALTETGKDGDENESRKNKSPESIIQDAFHSILGGQRACKVDHIGSFYRLYVPDIETARKIARRIEDAVSNDDSDYDDMEGYPEESRASLLEITLDHPLLIASAFLLIACALAFFGYVA